MKAYVQKGERLHYLRLCGADISKFGTILKIAHAKAFNLTLLIFSMPEVNKFAIKAKAKGEEENAENAVVTETGGRLEEIEGKEENDENVIVSTSPENV